VLCDELVPDALGERLYRCPERVALSIAFRARRETEREVIAALLERLAEVADVADEAFHV
jgi:hypothetical protein